MAYDPTTRSWEFSDYRTQSTAALRLARARLHAQEISDMIAGRVQGLGESFDSTPLLPLLKLVDDAITKLEGQVRAECGAGLPTFVSTVTRDLRRR